MSERYKYEVRRVLSPTPFPFLQGIRKEWTGPQRLLEKAYSCEGLEEKL